MQIFPGLKAKLWLTILVNKKIKSCNAKREGNENGIKISKEEKLYV